MTFKASNSLEFGGMSLPPSLKSLLTWRICDFPLSIAGTPLQTQVHGLYRDLEMAGFRHFRPTVYLGDEWFSPEGLPAIAAPFYLVDPRLKKIEAMLRREVEGGNPKWCRQLLRHEAGHAFEHAFEIASDRRWRRAWREVFGNRSRPYAPQRYKVDVNSHAFVRHLPDHYAQAHPDEDFAETFAVAVTPGSNAERIYRDQPIVLRKLAFMSELIRYYSAKKPIILDSPTCYDASRLRRTLGSHYSRYLP